MTPPRNPRAKSSLELKMSYTKMHWGVVHNELCNGLRALRMKNYLAGNREVRRRWLERNRTLYMGAGPNSGQYPWLLLYLAKNPDTIAVVPNVKARAMVEEGLRKLAADERKPVKETAFDSYRNRVFTATDLEGLSVDHAVDRFAQLQGVVIVDSTHNFKTGMVYNFIGTYTECFNTIVITRLENVFQE